MQTKNNKKTIFILIGVFAVFILGFMGLMVYGLVNTLSDEEEVQITKDVGFEAIAIENEVNPNPSESSEQLKQKRMIYEETNKTADNKDISFEVVSNDKNTNYPIAESEKPRSLLDPLPATTSRQPNNNTSRSTKPTPTSSPKKDEKVLNDLALLYKTDGANKSPSNPQQQQGGESELERRKSALQNGFSSSHQTTTNKSKSIIYAVVHGTQTIKMNGQILLRVTSADGKTDDNLTIPMNTLVYGEVSSIKDGRLQISFSSALINGNLHPFSYNLFSLDGRSGIIITSNKAVEEATDATKQAVTTEVRRSATNMLATAVDLITDISRSSNKEARLQLTLIDNQTFHLYSKK